MKPKTKLDIPPLKYPNGGGLKAMAKGKNNLMQMELNVHDAASELKRQQIIAKHNRPGQAQAKKVK